MSVTRFVDGRHVAVAPFDLETTGSDKRLAALARALIAARGWWTDVGVIGGEPPNGRSTVLFRVWIPEGSAGRVAKDSRCEAIRVPPCLMLNDSRDRRVVCRACGVAFNARRAADDTGEDPRVVVSPERLPATCSLFCAGRLVGRAEQRETDAGICDSRYAGHADGVEHLRAATREGCDVLDLPISWRQRDAAEARACAREIRARGAP